MIHFQSLVIVLYVLVGLVDKWIDVWNNCAAINILIFFLIFYLLRMMVSPSMLNLINLINLIIIINHFLSFYENFSIVSTWIILYLLFDPILLFVNLNFLLSFSKVIDANYLSAMECKSRSIVIEWTCLYWPVIDLVRKDIFIMRVNLITEMLVIFSGQALLLNVVYWMAFRQEFRARFC